MPQLLVFCLLAGTAKGEVLPELGLTGTGSRALEVADSTEADDSSSTVANVAVGLSSFPLRFLLEGESLLADSGEGFDGDSDLQKVL